MSHFGRVVIFGSLLAVFVVTAPADVFAQKKKDTKAVAGKGTAATEADYKAIRNQKELIGKLIAVDPGLVTIRVDYPHYEANPKFKPPTVTNPKAPGYNAIASRQYQMWRTYNDLMKQQAAILKAKTPRELMLAQQRYYQDMMRLQQEIYQLNLQMAKATSGGVKVDTKNDPFILVTSTKDFDLEVQDKVVVRKLFLPFEYDDLGKPKAYTDKEKEELRGKDKSKPGYMAKFEEILPGQEVKLYLTPPPPKKNPVKKDEGDIPMMEIDRPTINMIVMTKENTMPMTSGPAKEKKKKK